jgi:predicted RNA-binding Zn ribbon-like protein
MSGDPEAAGRALRQAHALREAIYRSFSAVAAGEAPPPADVRRVLRAYGIAVGRASFGVSEADAGLGWPVPTRPSRVLDPIAYAAGELLLASDPPPVKECPGCCWLFLDRSRNGSRRWCDMQTCGSRDKMRRYYRTHRRTPS